MAEKKPKDRKARQRKPCKKCGNTRGVVHKYNINLCRMCFKELAEKLDFRKYD